MLGYYVGVTVVIVVVAVSKNVRLVSFSIT